MSAAVSTMIGAAATANTEHREMTISEAGWSMAGGCPLFLPIALLGSMCRDNPATYEVARLALRYSNSPQGLEERRLVGGIVSEAPFTRAYGEACNHGRLSPEFIAFAQKKGLLGARRAAVIGSGHRVHHRHVSVHLK